MPDAPWSTSPSFFIRGHLIAEGMIEGSGRKGALKQAKAPEHVVSCSSTCKPVKAA